MEYFTEDIRLKSILDRFKQEHPGYRLIALSKTGSTLFGTNSSSSDIDYRGIFVADIDSLLLKSDIDSYLFKTNTDNTKNSSDDLDFSLWSIQQFFNLLKKMETNAVDLFFSLTQDSNENVLFVDGSFKYFLRTAKDHLITSDMRSFSGYALGQVKRYQIKGKRYAELDDFIKSLDGMCRGSDENDWMKLSDIWLTLKDLVDRGDYQYVKFVMAPGSGKSEHEYISVLGRLFLPTVTLGYFFEKINTLYQSFGNRTTTTALSQDKVDFKALSHAYRIATEVKEVLLTGRIVFPLAERDYIKQIKAGELDYMLVVEQVESLIYECDNIVEQKLYIVSDEFNSTIADNIMLEIIRK